LAVTGQTRGCDLSIGSATCDSRDTIAIGVPLTVIGVGALATSVALFLLDEPTPTEEKIARAFGGTWSF
jgi:hypothetical protein